MTNARDKANIPVLNFQSKGIDDNADATAITIDSSERVGIGTSSPSTILHVQQSAVSNAPSRTSALYLENNANCEIQFVGNSSNDCQIRFGTSSNSFKGAIEYELDNNNFEFYTNGSERMRITSAGLVGIGTSSPSATVGTDKVLEIAGSVSPGLVINDTGQAQKYQLYADSTKFKMNYGSTNFLTYDASNSNLGISTTSPTLPLEVSGSGLFGGSVIATGSTTTTASRRAIMTHDGSSMKLMASGDSTHRNIIFYRDGGSDEAMRIDTSNRLQVGNATSLWNMNFNVHQGSSLASEDGYNGTPPIRLYQRTNHTGGLFVEITNSAGGRIGSITRASSTSVAYNTTSDYRLKENVVNLDNATARLKQLQPKRFNFIADPDTTVDGFLAHEVSDIVPEAINGEKDEVRDFGNIVDENNNIIEENVNENHKKEDSHTWVKTETKPVYQGIDQSKLVPLLVKTIQELEARITTLEANNP